MPYRDDKEDLGDSDWDQDESVEMEDCPQCRRPVYEESEQCPYCGHYITQEDGRSRHPTWFVVTAMVCLALALGWVLWG